MSKYSDYTNSPHFFISDSIVSMHIVKPNVVHNILADATMDQIMHYTKREENELDDYFTKDKILCANKNLKENNYYAFDKYGIIIRRKEFNNTKSVYGWMYTEDKEIVSVHADEIMMKLNSADIRSRTLTKLKSKFPAYFNEKSIYVRVKNNMNLSF